MYRSIVGVVIGSTSVRRSAVFAALCGLLLGGCGATRAGGPARSVHQAHTARTAAPGSVRGVLSGPPHPEAQGTVTVSLPVTKIPVESPVTQTKAILRTLSVTIPAAWQGAVGAYWADFLFIGPVGWNGKGVFGADGSGGVTLYPPGANPDTAPYHGPEITISTAGGCLGCGNVSAAQFFPYVRRHWREFLVIPGPAPMPAQVLSQVALSQDVVAYRLPDTPTGFEVNGVAFSQLPSGGGLPFEQMDTVLSAKDHGLATVTLNYFLSHDLTGLP